MNGINPMNLDDLKALRSVDTHDVMGHVGHLPDMLETAWTLGQSFDLPDTYRRVSRMVIAAVGAAAVPGDLLAALAADTANVPIAVVRGYDLPAYADGQSTLVVIIDHEGQNEESFSALELADARGVKTLVMTSGGALAEFAVRSPSGVVLWKYTPSAPLPASHLALGWQMGLLLALIQRVGLVRDLTGDFAEMLALLRARQAAIAPDVPADRNLAKRLAGQMMGRLPLVYGTGIMAPVARHWKQQINTVAKAPALWDELPELDYNTLNGLGMLPEGIRLAVVCLASPGFDHPRIRVRQNLTRQVFMMEGCVPDTLEAQGESALAQMLYSLHFGDYVALYLALCYGVDPAIAPASDEVREHLASTR